MLILCILTLAGRSVQDDACGTVRGEGVSSLHSFSSPNYPNPYPSNTDCVRVIQARPGFDVLVRFHHHFQIETSYAADEKTDRGAVTSDCPNDFIEFRDGRYGFSPLIGRFCGMSIPKADIRAKSGFLWIRFRSDELLEYKGFYASYDMVRSTDRTMNQHDCLIEHRHALDGYVGTKSLISDLALNFTGSLDCIWLLEVPHEYSIVLYINEFSLYSPNQCGLNFFEVYSGTTSDTPLKRYCGMTAAHVFSTHYLMYIRFYLHDANQIRNTSISALYSSYIRLRNCSSKQLFNCGDENCIPRSLGCNGHINCPYGNDEINCHVGKSLPLAVFLQSYRS
ncbi:CUB domain-containing protein [Trichostrongylus colubriformis]|uniref:CUB domain-containing protein n=1 Tax=Trichostrongylus colubriformis TaxID=6319 RepID=A0AAN8IFJ0_TRICO